LFIWYAMAEICGSTNDAQRRQVTRMNAAMDRRGPSVDRTYTDYLSGVSLSARRLRIIDISVGQQPVTNEDGTVWAVLAGEIYNHGELRKGLLVRGHRFVSGVDAEVLVHVYEENGVAIVDALEGTYAFALWDARQRELLVVRDRFGEEPLFYIEHGGALLFASELDALVAGTERDIELEPASVDAFFTFGYVSDPSSILHGVKELPSGHLLRWERRSRRVRVEAYSHFGSRWTGTAATA
jgi:asparagine synthase (glutamine-hydrolysing)